MDFCYCSYSLRILSKNCVICPQGGGIVLHFTSILQIMHGTVFCFFFFAEKQQNHIWMRQF